MIEECMLTTFDNKWNPFTNWDDWWKEDHDLGHCCCEYLARISSDSFLLSDEFNDKEALFAIEEIILRDPDPNYCKIFRNGEKSRKLSLEH